MILDYAQQGFPWGQLYNGFVIFDLTGDGLIFVNSILQIEEIFRTLFS